MKGKRWLPWAVVTLAATLALAIAGSSLAQPHQAVRPAATVKVGLVSDVGRFNDKSFNQSQLEGLKLAKAKLGAQIRAVESRAASDYIPNLSSLARQNFDLTIAAGFLLADSLKTVATKFPSQNFAITDFSAFAPPFGGKVKNVVGLTYATNENSYLIGYLAGLMVKKQGGPQVVSVVAGVKIPPVDIFLAGYRAGAKASNPSVKVLLAYSQDFVAQDKCKELALNQIAKGSQVVFQVAGGCGLGALDAAKEKGVWGVGVDRDQSFLGPHILTSAVKRVDRGVFLTAKAVSDGNFQGGTDLVFNLKNGGVTLGKISPKVPQAFIAKVNQVKAQIIAGTIKPPTKV